MALAKEMARADAPFTVLVLGVLLFDSAILSSVGESRGGVLNISDE